jgi:hypothetical protein
MGIHNLKLLLLFVIFLVTVISSWIIGIQMRGKIKRDLGRRANKRDLTSIETWMKVDEVEEKKNPGREWVPQSLDLLPESDLVPEDEKPIAARSKLSAHWRRGMGQLSSVHRAVHFADLLS